MNIKAKVAAIAAATGIVLAGGGAAYAATSTDAPKPVKQIVCVKYGPKGGQDATGNVMLWDWNRSACPAGTYTVSLTDTDNFVPAPVPTGGASTGTTQANPMG